MRIELDGVDVAQLPAERRTALSMEGTDSKSDDGTAPMSSRLAASESETDNKPADDESEGR